MSQVTIYIENPTLKKLKSAAKKSGLSVSRWITGLVNKELNSQWPKDVQDLAGAWIDFPDAENLRKNTHKDTRRESF